MPVREALAAAGLCASLVAATAQAGSPLCERIWVKNVGYEIADAWNSKGVPNREAGIADVELRIDPEGRATVVGVSHLCGPPELDQELASRLQGLWVSRPPASAAGRAFRWRVVFVQPFGALDNTWGVVTRCRGGAAGPQWAA